MAVFELDQVNVDPVGVLVNAVAETVALLQMVIGAIGSTVGVGKTPIVNEDGVPTHPATVGVTVIVPLMVVVPLLTPLVKLGMFPVPDAPKPIAVLELDQDTVPPAGEVVNDDVGTGEFGQYVAAVGTMTVGDGKMLMV